MFCVDYLFSGIRNRTPRCRDSRIGIGGVLSEEFSCFNWTVTGTRGRRDVYSTEEKEYLEDLPKARGEDPVRHLRLTLRFELQDRG